jgi:hypothetical protein
VTAARCIAPIDGERLCGRPAKTTRTVEGITCPLCGAHARELDGERPYGTTARPRAKKETRR